MSNSCLAITEATGQLFVQHFFLGEHPDLSDRYIHELLSTNVVEKNRIGKLFELSGISINHSNRK